MKEEEQNDKKDRILYDLAPRKPVQTRGQSISECALFCTAFSEADPPVAHQARKLL